MLDFRQMINGDKQKYKVKTTTATNTQDNELTNEASFSANLNYEKNLISDRGPGIVPKIETFTNEWEEASWIIDNLKENMPVDKPRYLMGVGTPSDILGAVKRGIDMFDCVLPTRSGRTGLAFTWNGRIQIRNSENKFDNTPLDSNVTKFDLNKYSKNYLNHLFNTNEILASMLLTLHNINFYQELMHSIRDNIKKGTFLKFHDKYIDIL